MWLANLMVLLIIAGCAAYQYVKSTLTKALATLVIAVCAVLAAFGYFELLAEVFLGRSGNSRFGGVVPWAQPLSLALIFVITFAILQTAVGQLTRVKVDLGLWPERIGRIVCGIFLGLLLSGLALTALVMGPLPNSYPYPRFDERAPDPDRPNKVLFNADGFAVGWASIASKGSFSSKQSFAVLHPEFLNQAFLNRLKASAGVPLIVSAAAIQLPPKDDEGKVLAVWPAAQSLRSGDDKPVVARPGCSLTMVRMGIKRSALAQAGRFSLSQLRLICQPKGLSEKAFSGQAVNVYPLGYLEAADKLRATGLGDVINVQSTDFKGDGNVMYIDFCFGVPNDYAPVVLQFKQNSMLTLPSPVGIDEAPDPAIFVESSGSGKKR